jgi:hypothetical protein
MRASFRPLFAKTERRIRRTTRMPGSNRRLEITFFNRNAAMS